MSTGSIVIDLLANAGRIEILSDDAVSTVFYDSKGNTYTRDKATGVVKGTDAQDKPLDLAKDPLP